MANPETTFSQPKEQVIKIKKALKPSYNKKKADEMEKNVRKFSMDSLEDEYSKE